MGPGGFWGRVTGEAGLLPATGWGRTALVFGVVVFMVLDALVLLGSDFALGLLVFATGLAAGLIVAVLATLPVRRTLERGGSGNLFGFLAGLASTFVIVFLATSTAGIPAYPTAEGGHLGTAIYGFALAFGATVCRISLRPAAAPPPVPRAPAARDETRAIWLRAAAVLVGAVAGLFGLLFVAFVSFRYVLVPVVELFVP